MATRLYDQLGSSVGLGAQLGRGGEGAVFEIVGQPTRVAKLYHLPISARKAAKLSAMVPLATSDLISTAAWPVGTLHSKQGGPLAGIVLPRISGAEEIFKLYSPAHRKLSFPAADWAFLIHTAQNVACAFEAIHAAGHVVGDVNQGNVMVARDARVALIDCDSFQVTRNGSTWLCEVGVGHFTPPELHGCSFEKVQRTVNHDAFGLAVLVFHLLFMGRHPFAGRYAGKGDMPIEEAIRTFRFAFSQTAATRQMAPPPYSLRLVQATQPVANLFEQAFGPLGANGATRPAASVWRRALGELEQALRPCGRYKGHKFGLVLSECPWCEIERHGGPDFFITVNIGQRAGDTRFDVDVTMQAVSAVQIPKPVPLAPSIPVSKGSPVAVRVKVGGLVGWCSAALSVVLAIGTTVGWPWALVVASLVGWVFAWWASGYWTERWKRQMARRSAEAALRRVLLRWEEEGGKLRAEFMRRVEGLSESARAYRVLPAEEVKERAELLASREAAQREAWLERHFIDRAKISGIGAGLKATLASYGVETAADINSRKLHAIQGFGPSRVGLLVSWRRSVEGAFRFDPRRAVDPAAIRAVEIKFDQRRRLIESDLTRGPADLRGKLSTFESLREKLVAEVGSAAQRLSQARADARMIW